MGQDEIITLFSIMEVSINYEIIRVLSIMVLTYQPIPYPVQSHLKRTLQHLIIYLMVLVETHILSMGLVLKEITSQAIESLKKL
jgi:hypothetical protein